MRGVEILWEHTYYTCLSFTRKVRLLSLNLVSFLSSHIVLERNDNHIKVPLKLLKIKNKILIDFFTFSVSSSVSLSDPDVVPFSFWLSLSYSLNKSIFNYSFSVLQSLKFHILTILDNNKSLHLILLKSLFVCSEMKFFLEFFYFSFLFLLHFNEENHQWEICFPFKSLSFIFLIILPLNCSKLETVRLSFTSSIGVFIFFSYQNIFQNTNLDLEKK